MGFVAAGLQPFGEHGAGDVDVFAEGVGGVSAQEQTVENRRLPLGGKWIEFFPMLQHMPKICSYYRVLQSGSLLRLKETV